MFVATQLIGFGASRNNLPKLIYLGSNISGSDLTTYDFGNFTAPLSGLLVVGNIGRSPSGNRNLSSVSIGGSAATVHANPGGEWNPAGISSLFVGPGSINVQATFSGGMDFAAAGVWLLPRAQSGTSIGSAGSNHGNQTNTSISFDIPARGVTCYVAWAFTNPMTWGSATEDEVLSNPLGNGAYVHFAHKFTDTALSGWTETVTHGTQAGGMAGASWNS
jgi:hypothetical protein